MSLNTELANTESINEGEKTMATSKLVKFVLVQFLLTVSAPLPGLTAPAEVAFSQSAQSVEAYDFVEVTLTVTQIDAKNPVTDVTVEIVEQLQTRLHIITEVDTAVAPPLLC